jgi:hypothetical protein
MASGFIHKFAGNVHKMMNDAHNDLTLFSSGGKKYSFSEKDEDANVTK